MKKITVFLVLLVSGVVIAAGTTGTAAASAVEPQSREYPVPGAPMFVALQSADHIWFTSPAENVVGQISLTPALKVEGYLLPTYGAEPYRITVADGLVWFTERSGNKIGRLDPNTGNIDEFPIPVAGSQPTGIGVLPGTPTIVWFAQSAAPAAGMGRLVITDTTDFAFTEYPFPSHLPGRPARRRVRPER